MKKSLLQIGLLSAAIIVSPADATPVDLQGGWRYSIKPTRTYYSKGVAQSGSFSNLGAGYYRSGTINGLKIVNTSYSTRSGSLSLEFWRLNYYGGVTGNVLLSRGYSPLSARYMYSPVAISGLFYSPAKYGYGDISLVEWQYSDWREVDDMPFSGNQYF